jgi:hypothetical protein
MCPACMASAALIAGGVITTGGLSALVGKILHIRKSPRTNRVENTTQRRNDHDYVDEQDGTFKSRATS